MQTEIELLPDHLINQIAAGEVIENPASVIKELVENSLDAKSSKIEIEIKAGGMLLIRVSDDGIGMNQKNLRMSLLRHATSKIKSFEDLQKVKTMGFRGEALASIASISKLRIESAKDGEAYTLSSDGGKEEAIEPCSRTCGTQVEVKSLFFNVPVRKKFQRSTITLTNEILKTIINLALANPFIAFTFISDGRKVIDVKRGENISFKEALEVRIKAILGESIFNYLTWIDEISGQINIQGFIASPLFSKRNRSGQYLFLNGRSVVSEVISRAVKEGYGTRIDEKDYPVFILHILTEPKWLDVNVHPQKKHVRILDDQTLRSIVQRVINDSFSRKNFESGIGPSFQFFKADGQSQHVQSDGQGFVSSGAENVRGGNIFNENDLARSQVCETRFFETGILETSLKETEVDKNRSLFEKYRQEEIFSSFRNYKEPQDTDKKFNVKIVAKVGHYCLIDPSSDFFFFDRLLSKLNEIKEREKDLKDILTANQYSKDDASKGSLFAVDLKSASAAIFYESIKKAKESNSSFIEKQSLNIPVIIDLLPGDQVSFQNNLELFSNIGFELRFIGDMTIAVDTIPSFLKKDDFTDYLNAVLQEIDLFGKSQVGEKLIEKKLAQKVCKIAKSRQDNYSEEEAIKVVGELLCLSDPFHDPLGDSTIIKIETDDLTKLFVYKKGEKCLI